MHYIWYLKPVFKTLHDRPALFGQESLPVLAVSSAARHGAQQVGVDLYDLVDIIGCCRAVTHFGKGDVQGPRLPH